MRPGGDFCSGQTEAIINAIKLDEVEQRHGDADIEVEEDEAVSTRLTRPLGLNRCWSGKREWWHWREIRLRTRRNILSRVSPRLSAHLESSECRPHITRKQEVARDVVVFVRAVHALCNVRVVRKHEYINDSLHAFLKIFGSTHERKATIEDQHVDTGICRERPDLDGWLCPSFASSSTRQTRPNVLEIFLKKQVFTRYTCRSQIQSWILRNPSQRVTWTSAGNPADIPAGYLYGPAPVSNLSPDRSVIFFVLVHNPGNSTVLIC